jgi:hypothetical protein
MAGDIQQGAGTPASEQQQQRIATVDIPGGAREVHFSGVPAAFNTAPALMVVTAPPPGVIAAPATRDIFAELKAAQTVFAPSTASPAQLQQAQAQIRMAARLDAIYLEKQAERPNWLATNEAKTPFQKMMQEGPTMGGWGH